MDTRLKDHSSSTKSLVPKHLLTKTGFFHHQRGSTRPISRKGQSCHPEVVAAFRRQLSLMKQEAREGASAANVPAASAGHARAQVQTADKPRQQMMEFLRNTGLSLPPEGMELVVKHMYPVEVKQHTVLCTEGQEGNCFFFLLKGEVLCNCGYNGVNNGKRHTRDREAVQSGAVFEGGTNVVLGAVSVVGEEVVLSDTSSDSGTNSVYHVTCVVHSSTAELYVVFSPAFAALREAFACARRTALYEKGQWLSDSTVGVSGPEDNGGVDGGGKGDKGEDARAKSSSTGFYEHLGSVRGTVGVIRPYRGMFSLTGYDEGVDRDLRSNVRRTSTEGPNDGVSVTRSTTSTTRSIPSVTTATHHEPPAPVAAELMDTSERMLEDHLRQQYTLNFRGVMACQRAYETFQVVLARTETAQRSDVRKLMRDMSGPNILKIKVQQLWARNPRAWRSIVKDSTPGGGGGEIEAKDAACEEKGPGTGAWEDMTRMTESRRCKLRTCSEKTGRRDFATVDAIIDRCNNVLDQGKEPISESYIEEQIAVRSARRQSQSRTPTDEGDNFGASEGSEDGGEDPTVPQLKKAAMRTMAVLSLRKVSTSHAPPTSNSTGADKPGGKAKAKGGWGRLKGLVRTATPPSISSVRSPRLSPPVDIRVPAAPPAAAIARPSDAHLPVVPDALKANSDQRGFHPNRKYFQKKKARGQRAPEAQDLLARS